MVDLEKKDSRCQPFGMVLWKHIQYCPLLLIEYTTVEKHKATPLQLTFRKLDLSFIYIASENCEIHFHQEIHIQLFVSFYDTDYVCHEGGIGCNHCSVFSTSACCAAWVETCLFNACLVCVWIMSTPGQRLAEDWLYSCLYNQPAQYWPTTTSPSKTANRHVTHGTNEN